MEPNFHVQRRRQEDVLEEEEAATGSPPEVTRVKLQQKKALGVLYLPRRC